LADLHRSLGGGKLSNDNLEQRGFAQPVPPGDADPLAVLEHEVESAKQGPPAKFHADVAQLDDAIAQWWRRRDAKLCVLLNGRPVLRGGVVVTLEPVFLFAALRTRTLADPSQFLSQKHLALVLNGRIGGLAFSPGQEVIGVVAVVPEEPAIGQLDHAPGHTVEKVAV